MNKSNYKDARLFGARLGGNFPFGSVFWIAFGVIVGRLEFAPSIGCVIGAGLFFALQTVIRVGRCYQLDDVQNELLRQKRFAEGELDRAEVQLANSIRAKSKLKS